MFFSHCLCYLSPLSSIMPTANIPAAILEFSFDSTCSDCWNWKTFQESIRGLYYPPWSKEADIVPPTGLNSSSIPAIRAFINAWSASNNRDSFLKAQYDQNSEGRKAFKDWCRNQYRRRWKFSSTIDHYLEENKRMPHHIMEAMNSKEVYTLL